LVVAYRETDYRTGMPGDWYSQNFSAARQTPPPRSHSIWALILGDAAGADWLDTHPAAVRLTATAIEASFEIRIPPWRATTVPATSLYAGASLVVV